MIEQLHISTTPKYNFPHLIDFPQQFLELSIRTLKNFHNFNSYDLQIEDSLDLARIHKLRLIRLKPLKDETTIAAVDVSSIKIGETPSGVIIAIRGAIVYKKGKKYLYLRLGPFPIHITEENKNEVYRFFGSYPTSVQNGAYDITIAPEINYIQSRITGLFERWLHINLATSMHNSLVLWDGSLTAGTPEKPVRAIEDIMEIAKRNRNIVLAISKLSRIRVGGHQISDFAVKLPSPCLVELEKMPPRHGSIKNLGRVYLAKLNGSRAFRLDIYRGFPNDEGIKAVEKLIGNDLLTSGYPETLRLAHIFSTFTANEVIGIQRYLTEHFNLKILDKSRIRRVLFGPYGKEHEIH